MVWLPEFELKLDLEHTKLCKNKSYFLRM